jgi:hypothetical protein
MYGVDNLPGMVFVSDMPWVRSSCGWNALLGWGPVEAVRDAGEPFKDASIAGLPYRKAVWTNTFNDATPADVVLDLSQQKFTVFKCHVGLLKNHGTVQFVVLIDGKPVEETAVQRFGTLQSMCVKVDGAKEVVLRVLNGGDDGSCDSALWGYPRLIQAGVEDPLEVPPAELHSATAANAAFFLAEVHWRLDQEDLARRWFDKAAEWMDKNKSVDEQLRSYRDETAELLGLSDTPAKESGEKKQPKS